MKKIMTLAAVLALTSAQAADVPVFGDINYFYQQNELSVLGDFNTSARKSTTGGTTYEARGYIFETQFTYGVSDKINAFIGLDYAWDLEVQDKTTSANADYNLDGLANPELGVMYRFMNQSSDNFNVDFGAIGRINVQDAEDGESTGQASNDGNFAEARSALELMGRVGKKWNEANEWQVAAGLVYFKDGESTYNGVGGDATVDEDSSTDLYLRGSYQYRPVREFMLLVFAQLNRVGEFSSTTEGFGKETQESHYDKDYGFTAKYLFTDNLIGRFNYRISHNSDIDLKDGSEIKDQTENAFGLGVEFLF